MAYSKIRKRIDAYIACRVLNDHFGMHARYRVKNSSYSEFKSRDGDIYIEHTHFVKELGMPVTVELDLSEILTHLERIVKAAKRAKNNSELLKSVANDALMKKLFSDFAQYSTERTKGGKKTEDDN